MRDALLGNLPGVAAAPGTGKPRSTAFTLLSRLGCDCYVLQRRDRTDHDRAVVGVGTFTRRESVSIRSDILKGLQRRGCWANSPGRAPMPYPVTNTNGIFRRDSA